MANPLTIALKGKGFLPLLARGKSITDRYGLTTRKMDQALAALSATVQQHGSSASLPVTASALAANPEVAQKYSRQGIELAIHGLQHVDYSALSYEKQLEHIRQAKQIFQDAGIAVNGFRCPYLRWNDDTLRALRALDFLYDSSQALYWDLPAQMSSPGYAHAVAFYRAKPVAAYPALPRMEDGLVRIPYCVPDDESLVERLNLSGGAMADLWLEMLNSTYETGELFTLGLHPERAPQCMAALDAVLRKARSLSPCVWIARLDEIARWYAALGKTTFELKRAESGQFHIDIQAPAGAAVLARGLEVAAPTQAWMHGYQLVMVNQFSLRSSARPVIGTAPGSSPALTQFLRHQGYLVETGTQAQEYSLYLDRLTFAEEDERPLIDTLEQSSLPLVRLSRWPDAARSALAVTGDVDALTLLDYGRRILYR